MQILIVDDLVSRADFIDEEVRQITSHIRVDTVRNSHSAKHNIKSNQYDLIIVDLNLPDRANAEPKANLGIDVIRFAQRDTTFTKPHSIIALTSDATSVDNYKQQLQEMNCTLIHCDDDNRWVETIRFAINALTAYNRHNVDLLFVTTTPIEEKAVLEHSNITWDGKVQVNDYIDYAKGSIQNGETPIKVACVRSNRMGMIESSIITSSLLTYLKPKFAVMTGICAGISNKAKLGDIIIASEAWDWQSGKYASTDEVDKFSPAPDSIKISDKLLRLLTGNVEQLLNSPTFSPLCSAAGIEAGNVHIAPVVSGSAVIADLELTKAIAARHRKIAGIDMEIYGFYAAFRAHPEIKTNYMAIKSVSDLGDERKDDTIQGKCATLSSNLAIEVARLSMNDPD